MKCFFEKPLRKRQKSGKIKTIKGGVNMEHITVGRKYNEGKVAFVECVKNGLLDNINIRMYDWLWIWLYERLC